MIESNFIAYLRYDLPESNPKSEYRNPKQTQRVKSQLQNPKRARLDSSFFGHLNLFRISDFEFGQM